MKKCPARQTLRNYPRPRVFKNTYINKAKLLQKTTLHHLYLESGYKRTKTPGLDTILLSVPIENSRKPNEKYVPQSSSIQTLTSIVFIYSYVFMHSLFFSRVPYTIVSRALTALESPNRVATHATRSKPAAVARLHTHCLRTPLFPSQSAILPKVEAMAGDLLTPHLLLSLPICTRALALLSQTLCLLAKCQPALLGCSQPALEWFAE